MYEVKGERYEAKIAIERTEISCCSRDVTRFACSPPVRPSFLLHFLSFSHRTVTNFYFHGREKESRSRRVLPWRQAFQPRGRFLVRPLPLLSPFLDLKKVAGRNSRLLVPLGHHYGNVSMDLKLGAVLAIPLLVI